VELRPRDRPGPLDEGVGFWRAHVLLDQARHRRQHFADEAGITTTGFPDKPPAAQRTSIGGQNAIFVKIDYSQGAEKDQQQVYITAHNGVGYVISYVALGDEAIKTIDTLAQQVNKSIKFTNKNETPPPAPSPSPGESPSAGASPSASAKP
jgi:hypothetical protein